MTKLYPLLAGVAFAVTLATAANADTFYDQSLAVPPGFFNGTSQPNAGFTTNDDGGAVAALGVLYRYGNAVHPAAGTSVYDVSSGFYTGPGGSCIGVCSKWNIQYSLDLRPLGLTIADLTSVTLTVVNLGTGGSVSFDPLTTFTDNNGWSAGGGKDGSALGTDTIFQNSENLAFGEFSTGTLNFNPGDSASYLVTLSYSTDANEAVWSVDETINATPIPAALPLFASGLGALGLVAHRRKRKAAAVKSAAVA
jgi:hypothetical protein